MIWLLDLTVAEGRPVSERCNQQNVATRESQPTPRDIDSCQWWVMQALEYQNTESKLYPLWNPQPLYTGSLITEHLNNSVNETQKTAKIRKFAPVERKKNRLSTNKKLSEMLLTDVKNKCHKRDGCSEHFVMSCSYCWGDAAVSWRWWGVYSRISTCYLTSQERAAFTPVSPVQRCSCLIGNARRQTKDGVVTLS